MPASPQAVEGAAAPMPVIYHPGLGAQVNYEVRALSDDPDEQVAQTVELMRGYIREDTGTPAVARDAAEALDQSPGQDPIAAVFAYVHNQLRFVQDEITARPFDFAPDVIETLIRPVDMAVLPPGSKLGDCDDYVMYAAALLKTLGVESRMVTVSADANDPSRYSHVYLAVYRNGQRIPFDVSHGPYPGWETPNIYGKRREWDIWGPGLVPAVGLLFGLAALAFWAQGAHGGRS